MPDVSAALGAAFALIRAVIEDDRAAVDVLAGNCDATAAEALAWTAAQLITTRRGASAESVARLLDDLQDALRRQIAAAGS